MEGQTSKRRRVYTLEPNTPLRSVFSHKYLNCLLPALLKIDRERSSDGKENNEIEKIVRFEVDMALVVSADRFGWSRALKQKLEKDMNDLRHAPIVPQLPSLSLLLTYKHNGATCTIKEKVNDSSPFLPLPRYLAPIAFPQNCNTSPNSEKSKRSKRVVRWRPRTKRATKGGDKEQLGCRLKTLRMLLPGGNEMGEYELLSEVESYVVCLELQVRILRSLVDRD